MITPTRCCSCGAEIVWVEMSEPAPEAVMRAQRDCEMRWFGCPWRLQQLAGGG